MFDLRDVESFKSFLRDLVRDYQFDVIGLYCRDGSIRPLPRESSVVGKVIEISLNEYLQRKLLSVPNLKHVKASGERSYPDISFSGALIYPHQNALDVKCARIKGDRTESAITIGTFDAEYFRYPEEKAANIMAPYSSYSAHLALIALYRYEDATARDIEILIVEKWRVATKKRSSGTRCYVGAVKRLEDLRAERGDFDSEEEFSSFWRSQAIDSSKENRWEAKRAASAEKKSRRRGPPAPFGD